MENLRVCTVAVFLFLASTGAWAQTKSYKVIVNPANPLVSISEENLSRVFLKKTTRFPNGHNASPIDQPMSSTIREHFSKDIHGKPASAVDAYWQQLIFSGRDIPPAQKNDSGVLDFVRSNENGIGYVSAGADTAGVKVILVTN